MLKVILFLTRLYFRLFNRIEVKGLERIPLSGPLIIVANHLSYADPPALLSYIFPVRSYSVMAKKELFKIWPLSAFLSKWGVIPVDRRREGGDLGALRSAIDTLKAGRCLVLFPEGTRARGRQLEPKAGVALLAHKTGAPVLAVRIFNTENFLKLGKITIKFGNMKNFTLAPGAARKEAYAEFSKSIMSEIFAITEN
ncbi:MAG: 1-acyl-sn-glycerol-3-phosphate acyltransferase [Elusimicrobia bacterium]|nr:1-acyl-sn-glycerol-3-phosphate acyltransferase [Elusimicrobiota bacterium]